MSWRTAVNFCFMEEDRALLQINPFSGLLLCAAHTLAHSLKCILSHMGIIKLPKMRRGVRGMRKR